MPIPQSWSFSCSGWGGGGPLAGVSVLRRKYLESLFAMKEGGTWCSQHPQRGRPRLPFSLFRCTGQLPAAQVSPGQGQQGHGESSQPLCCHFYSLMQEGSDWGCVGSVQTPGNFLQLTPNHRTFWILCMATETIHLFLLYYSTSMAFSHHR